MDPDEPPTAQSSTRSTTTTREMALSRAVVVSRVVWDAVLVPWLVPELRVGDGGGGDEEEASTLSPKHAVGLCVVGEALFPLRGLVRRALVAHTHKWRAALRAAAEAGSTSCVDWLIAWRRSRGQGEGEGADGDGGVLEPPSAVMQRRRRKNKEFVNVLWGLCVGGHLGEAQRLLGGGWPGLTWMGVDVDAVGCGSGSGSYWGEQDLHDHVRASGILLGACRRGWTDVAKWLVQRFGIRDPSEFAQPLEGALAGGHLELAQWMVGTFSLVKGWRKYSSMDFPSKVCRSENLDVVKWCFEMFPQFNVLSSYRTFASCIAGKTSSCLEICQYVRKHLELQHPPGNTEIDYVKRLDVLKWMMSEFSIVPTNEMAESLCRGMEGLEFIKFFVEGNLVTATPALFIAACRTFEDNTQLVKWLSTRVLLSQEDIYNSFVAALANSNTSIASWLEDSHHILDRHQGATAAGKLLVRVCERMPCYAGRTAGLKWLLNRIDTKCIPSDQAVDCVGDLLRNRKSTRAALLLLEKFPMIPKQERSSLLTLALRETVVESLPQVKRIVSMMDTHRLTKEDVSKCLSTAGFHSSKATKWLITEFQLQREHITADNNNILFNHILWGQEGCAEWLINKFNITFDEVLRSWDPSSFLSGFDLATWQMIVEVFPGITATIIKEKLSKLMCHSPVIAQFTLRHFPDIVTRQCSTVQSESNPPCGDC
ncbi:hypothetical protein Pelo_653 [Pelomyxa schiedti]|nr:hypothetical protein Pelo_653 [Pelomyxa schiedti]